MKLNTKNILRETAKQLGLKHKFVDYLPEDVHGKLLPRERRILINANKPRYEHVHTLLHEFAHYLLHFKNRTPQRHCPWYLKLDWKNDAIANIATKVRRAVRFAFNNERGKEWEADVWAICAFLLISKYVGSTDDLETFINHHPEKCWVFTSAAIAVTYCGIKYRIAKSFKMLLKPFRAG
jgi:hypothetical protein